HASRKKMAGEELVGAGAEAAAQLVPEPLVRPLIEILVGRDLQVVPRHARRAPAAQGEAMRMVDVGHLADRWRLRQDAEPAERKHAVPDRERAGRKRLAGDAMKAVAAGDDVADQRLFGAVDA